MGISLISQLGGNCIDPCAPINCAVLDCDQFKECFGAAFGDPWNIGSSYWYATKDLVVTVSGIGDDSCDECGILNRAYPGCYWYLGAGGCGRSGLWAAAGFPFGPYVCGSGFLVEFDGHLHNLFVTVGVWYEGAGFGLTGDAADAALATLCAGGVVVLPLVYEAHNFGSMACHFNNASVTLQLFEHGTVDCTADPPLPPITCEQLDECDPLSPLDINLGYFEDHYDTATDTDGHWIQWKLTNLNRPFQLEQTEPVAVGACAGSYGSLAFYIALGTEGNYSDPGILVRFDEFWDARNHHEWYVYGLLVVVTCSGGKTSITDVRFAIHTFFGYEGVNWPPASAYTTMCAGSERTAFGEGTPNVNCRVSQMTAQFTLDPNIEIYDAVRDETFSIAATIGFLE